MPRQSFNRIKRVYAAGGHVVLEVYDKPPTDGNEESKQISTKVLQVRQAAERARALNAMAMRMPKKDAQVAMDIVRDTIAACKEAQTQLQLPDSAVDTFVNRPIETEAPAEPASS
jgi:hypothetical protein